MQHLDLFSGIGGFALAAEMVWPDITHTFCDNDPFSQAILKKHWPQATIHGDIRALTNTKCKRLQGSSKKQNKHGISQSAENTGCVQRVDLLTGGFPCQPFSQAGRRLGTEDDRHLWPEMLRVIREFHPRWVVGENVGGFVTWNDGMVLEQVHTDLEGEGYSVQAFIIPAVSLNAPHRRDRVWIVANSQHQPAGDAQRRRNDKGSPTGAARPAADDTHPANTRLERCTGSRKENGSDGHTRDNRRNDWNQNWLEVATRLCTVDDGLPNGLARPRGWRNAALKGAGNAIVPQVAAQIMQGIKIIDDKNSVIA